MSRLVFLVEEYSMKVFLDGLLPRLFPGMPFLCVPHKGKHDLEKSIPARLRGWHEPGARFVVVRDKDGGDCHTLKARLAALCREGRRPDVVVRLACQELEAWYLGDADALADAFEDESLRGLGGRERFRDPDAVLQPARALRELVPQFQKTFGARRMAARLRRDGNRSRSFQVFVEGLERATRELGPTAPGQDGQREGN